METTRQLKFARLVQKELAEIFQQDKKNLVVHNMVSITRVEVSPDFSVAKAYLSFVMDKDKQEIFDKINDHKREIRGLLGRRIGKQVRIVPELVFYLDNSAEHAAKIQSLFKNLYIPPADENADDLKNDQ